MSIRPLLFASDFPSMLDCRRVPRASPFAGFLLVMYQWKIVLLQISVRKFAQFFAICQGRRSRPRSPRTLPRSCRMKPQSSGVPRGRRTASSGDSGGFKTEDFGLLQLTKGRVNFESTWRTIEYIEFPPDNQIILTLGPSKQVFRYRQLSILGRLPAVFSSLGCVS